MKTLYALAINLIIIFTVIACRADADKPQNNEEINNASKQLQQETIERNAILPQVPKTLLMKVQLDSANNPDFQNVEIRAVNNIVNTDDSETLAKAFNQGQNLGEIVTIDKLEELNLDTSTQSCIGHNCYHSYQNNLPRRWGYILPWRRRVANALYNNDYRSWPRSRGYLLPWRRRVANALYARFNNYYWPYVPYREYGVRYNSYVFYSLSSVWSSSSAWYYQNCGGLCGYNRYYSRYYSSYYTRSYSSPSYWRY